MFQDVGQTLEDFSDVIDVRCPQCGRHAQVARIVSTEDERRAKLPAGQRYALVFRPRKLSCLHCGHVKIWEKRTFVKSDARDWYFRLPVWLQTPCCGETLWALNGEHLALLERYVTAQLRAKMPPGQIRNRSIASRLPRWLKSAKNREAVTRGIVRLKGMLEEA